ncbi:unnamed protein product [Onchocerca flexuosa]|uniref:MATH domain-containing protein n=1 Tax=Onchocerca flexuosa TaxID=387005 RepID=A0A183H0R5_9BILA|nr:unnamed protein product [Onchocerca flexuosa]
MSGSFPEPRLRSSIISSGLSDRLLLMFPQQPVERYGNFLWRLEIYSCKHNCGIHRVLKSFIPLSEKQQRVTSLPGL